jgi:lipoprotein NlpI
MRYLGVLVGAVLVLGLAGPTLAASNRAWADCEADDPDRIIAGCTRIIKGHGETKKDRATAYANRGMAYSDNGDFDRAIDDLNEAIRLAPKFGWAFYYRGTAYDDNGDFDQAIADLTEAIRLDPKNADDGCASCAFDGRARAYEGKGDLERAMTDSNEAIRLDPGKALFHYTRGILYTEEGDIDHALADYNATIRLSPEDASYYFVRGLAYLYSSSLAAALDDFKQAAELEPKDAYYALWLDIAQRRSDMPSRLAQSKKHLDMKQWPAPVVRLFLGEASEEAMFAATYDTDATERGERVCEANILAAEIDLSQGQKEKAVLLFRGAVSACPRNQVERSVALAEIRALGQGL